ncbi:DIP1984 family protein [Thermogemmatispora carboxidivorans]|uniref:DIP1984 family protein n=1 Tax=Thermogemmatispora carboxidivorans TaxID=1382306 RepID=UPI000699B1AB|nr:DIP1984 family protein [Thermogemmatispora carboxidivorans]
MKLAEALVLRADMKKQLTQLRNRLTRSAIVQEGDQPPEKPEALLHEIEEILQQYRQLMVRINRTNLESRLPDGRTLTEAMAERDVLDLQHSILSDLAATASERFDRYGQAEIRRLPTVDTAAIYRQLDRIARQRRELDTAIQATNWAVDLLE